MSPSTLSLIACASVLALLGARPSRAAAQPPPSPDDAPANGEQAEQRAQELMERATAAFDAGDGEEAERLLTEALDLAPSAQLAYNRAVVLHAIARNVTALEALQELLDGRYGALPAERRAQVLELQAQTLRSVGTVLVRIAGVGIGEVQIDGAMRANVTIPGQAEVWVEPGQRRVGVVVDGELRSETLRVEPGGLHEVAFDVRPPPPAEPSEPAPIPAPPPPEDDRTIVEKPWFWAVLLVAAAAITVGIVIGVNAAGDGLYRDPVYDSTETLTYGGARW